MVEVVDYVVIGSGSAGGVIAARLAEDGHRVLVLEAGGSDDKYFYRRPGALGIVYEVPQLKASADWGYYTTPQPGLGGREMAYTRGKIVGGCSTVNGMLYLRGCPEDYDAWAAAGCDGWGYDDVLPLFKRSEDHEDGAGAVHGAGGPLKVTRQAGRSPVTDAWSQAASAVTGAPVVSDLNAPLDNGRFGARVGDYHQTAAARRRSSVATAFLHPALARYPNMRLETEALVTELLIEDGRVLGVRYRKGGAERLARAEAEVVLAAGAINSPQILMRSGIGPADHLRALGIDVALDVPGVGANLHDHLYAPVRFHATKDIGHTSTAPHFLWGMFRDFVFNEGWFGKAFLETGAFVSSNADVSRPDLQFFTVPWGYPEPNDDRGVTPTIAKTPSLTVLAALLYPFGRGSLRLSSADPEAPPLIDPAFLVDDRDVQVLLRGVELARKISATEPLAQYITGEAFPGPDVSDRAALIAHVRRSSKTVYHPVGTCRMGSDDAAVVDPQLRLRGLAGLRVADASVMPTIVGGNTNAPTIMIGEKCAELMRA